MTNVKIVCTIGPASENEDMMGRLIGAGMNVARLNFSHGTHEEHARKISTIRKVAQKLNKPVAVLQDLQGPKIRIGTFKSPPVNLRQDDYFTITTIACEGDETRVGTTYKDLPHDVNPGDSILVNDGLIKLEVLEKSDTDVKCKVITGGALYDRRGINLPGVPTSEPSLTEKDRADLQFGMQQGVDYVALSFVRRPGDIEELKSLIGDQSIPVIAKLEKPQALQNLDAIISVTDAVMVARGDLGVEISTEQVPHIQKMIIEKCRKAGKPVITATQMLDSMMNNPIPTRAEATDVANAVFDCTDAVMLSGETAFGKYPLEAVRTMHSIIKQAEAHRHFFRLRSLETSSQPFTFSHAVCRAAGQNAQEIGAKYIIVFTKSGYTARIMSAYRPHVPIVAITDKPDVQRQLTLYWGVRSLLVNETIRMGDGMQDLENVLKEHQLVRGEDTLVIIAGSTMEKGGTNLLRLHRVSD
ncbi:MAG: pyruvate kinase [Caldithrix sp.]|nr:pyruvate kinase [Caldithrix sp.]